MAGNSVERLALLGRERRVEGLHRRGLLLQLLQPAIEPLGRGERRALLTGKAAPTRTGLPRSGLPRSGLTVTARAALRTKLFERRDVGAECGLLIRPDLQQVVQALLALFLHVLELLLTVAATRTRRPPGAWARTALLGGRRDDEAEAEDGRQGDALEGGFHRRKGSGADGQVR